MTTRPFVVAAKDVTVIIYGGGGGGGGTLVVLLKIERDTSHLLNFIGYGFGAS